MNELENSFYDLRPMPLEFAIPADFKSFDWRGDFWSYEGNLPHWRQPGVTFRHNDSPVSPVNTKRL
jgi:hypothetical protein